MPRPQAHRSRSAWILLLVVFFGGVTADLVSKSWSFEHVAPFPIVLDRERLLGSPEINPIPRHEGLIVLPFDLLKFELVINRGAVFGLGSNMRFFFVAFTILAVLGGIYVFCRYIRPQDRMAQVALGLILAGGIGNLYDRIVFGVVRDFLKMLPNSRLPFGWRWPGGSPEIFPWVFNVADMMLLGGMALMMFHLHRLDRIKIRREKTRSPVPASPAPAQSRSDQPE